MRRQIDRIDAIDMRVKTYMHCCDPPSSTEGDTASLSSTEGDTASLSSTEGDATARHRVDVVAGSRQTVRITAFRYAQLNWRARHNPIVPAFTKSTAESRWWSQHILRDRPSVILAHYGTTAVDLAPLARHHRVPIVAHFNGFDASKMMARRRYCRLLAESMDVIDRYVVVADYMRDNLLSLGIAPDKIVRIPYGVPSVDPVDRSGRIGPCQFIAVGRLVAKKRPDLTITAMAMMVDRLVAAGTCRANLPRLTIVGDGPLRLRCKRLIVKHRIDDLVEMTGQLPPDQTQRQMAAADVFVQHSVTAANGDREGWPVAIAEAAAWGLPIVATRHASIPEQIGREPAAGGLMCDEGDAVTMADHMHTMATDLAERKRMGRNSVRNMAAIDIDHQVQSLQNVLIEAAGGRSLVAAERAAAA